MNETKLEQNDREKKGREKWMFVKNELEKKSSWSKHDDGVKKERDVSWTCMHIQLDICTDNWSNYACNLTLWYPDPGMRNWETSSARADVIVSSPPSRSVQYDDFERFLRTIGRSPTPLPDNSTLDGCRGIFFFPLWYLCAPMFGSPSQRQITWKKFKEIATWFARTY